MVKNKNNLEFESNSDLLRSSLPKDNVILFALVALVILYFTCLLSDFITPMTLNWHDIEHANLAPQKIEWDNLKFFSDGQPYKLFGLFDCQKHLITFKDGQKYFILGSDRLGIDMLSLTLTSGLGIMLFTMAVFFITAIFGVILFVITSYENIFAVILRKIALLLYYLPVFLVLLIVIYFIKPYRMGLWGIPVLAVLYSFLAAANIYTRLNKEFEKVQNMQFYHFLRYNGASKIYILKKHLAVLYTPKFLSMLLKAAALGITYEVTLSFLDIGLDPNILTPGTLIKNAFAENSVHIFQAIPPAVLAMIIVILINLISSRLVSVNKK